jgi:carbamoyltransferase
MWRPIAPSVLERDWHEYFCDSRPDPFMIVAARVRRTKWSQIPAVVHVDGSARPQAVSPRTAPRFAALIEAFGRRTHVPVLANTSFNLADEPIVNTPADAVRTFFARPPGRTGDRRRAGHRARRGQARYHGA